ncbi:MAG TPA: metallophosphoesterase [Blastocatellia bacterium]|nr:metallophosphoesterase [Blastocatellia bacterium]
MNRKTYQAPLLLLALVLVGASSVAGFQNPSPAGQTTNAKEWRFAVSGDSRNCGDIVMPAIAQQVSNSQTQFYWHLGDFRAIYDFDQDMKERPSAVGMTIIGYEQSAWDDFIANQVSRFRVPVFLGIGNHETIPPKTRADYLIQFADWLNTPALKEQRLLDNPRDHRLKAYYHWAQGGVDFISLDNATPDQFDAAQMQWVESVLARDAANPDIKTVVVGMHQALPESIAANHSMNDSPVGVQSGRQLYKALLDLQNNKHKRVYVLASHSHYFMDGIFNTEYWRANGGVLPGWIIGTAGAVRYPLPVNAKDAKAARTNVYGYLLATVNPAGEPEGTIRFDFHEVQEADAPADVSQQMGKDLIQQCFQKNSQAH